MNSGAVPSKHLGELFKQLVPAAWTKECNKVLVHYYSCGIGVETLLSKGYFSEPNKENAEIITDKDAILFLMGIENQEAIYTIAFNVAVNESIKHFARGYRDRLPNSNYILAISRIGEQEDGEVVAEGNIEKAVGLLGVCTGRGVVLDFVTKLIVDLKTAIVSYPSRIMSVAKKFDFAVFDAAKTADELYMRRKHLTHPKANRINLSLTYVCRALAEQNLSLRFLLYWTAVEVITGGRPEGFVDRLAKQYEIGVEHRFDLRKKLRADEFIDARVALVHGGKDIKLSSYGERLFQAIVADLVFAVCNIKSRYALEFCSENLAEPVFGELRVGQVTINFDSILPG